MRNILFYTFFTLILACAIALIHVTIILLCNPISELHILAIIVLGIVSCVIAIMSIAVIVYKISENCKYD